VSASNGGTESGGVVTWPTIASLANGANASYTVTVTAPRAISVHPSVSSGEVGCICARDRIWWTTPSRRHIEQRARRGRRDRDV